MKIQSAKPVDMNALSEEEMNAALEKEYADGQLDRLENSISGLSKMPER